MRLQFADPDRPAWGTDSVAMPVMFVVGVPELLRRYGLDSRFESVSDEFHEAEGVLRVTARVACSCGEVERLCMTRTLPRGPARFDYIHATLAMMAHDMNAELAAHEARTVGKMGFPHPPEFSPPRKRGAS